MSFIERAKLFGVNSLLGLYIGSGTRFDSVLDDTDFRVLSIEEGKVVCEMTVTEKVSNTYKTLHGGAIATIIDVVGTMAIMTEDCTRAGVSVDMNITYIAAAKRGEKVRIEGKLLKKLGRKLGYTQVDLYDAATGKMIATGRHTKAL